MPAVILTDALLRSTAAAGRGAADSPFPSRTTAASHRVIVHTKARRKGRDASCKNPQSQSS
jgi:hypothetical protein